MLSNSAEIPGDSGSRGPKNAFGHRLGVLTVFVCVSGKNGMPQGEDTDQAEDAKLLSSVDRGGANS